MSQAESSTNVADVAAASQPPRSDVAVVATPPVVNPSAGRRARTRLVLKVVSVFALLACSAAAGYRAVLLVRSDLDAPSATMNVSRDELTADVEVLDFGAIPQREARSRVLTLKNTGSADIQIVDVQPSCGCTVANYRPGSIKPGESIPIRLTFNSDVYRGRVEKNCDVLYLGTSGDKRLLSVPLAAVVEPDFLFTPATLSFSRSRDAEAFGQVTIRPGRLLEVHVQKVECTHPAFSAQVLASPKDGRTRIRVFFDSGKWLGYSKQTRLLVTTNSSREPVLEIPLYGPPPIRRQ